MQECCKIMQSRSFVVFIYLLDLGVSLCNFLGLSWGKFHEGGDMGM